MLTCSKILPPIPFAHRQHRHRGDCRLIHGHNWQVKLTFAASTLDEHGFVVDFGGLSFVKSWLMDHLDHACVLSADDPELDRLRETGLFKLYVAPAASCEGLAKHLFHIIQPMIAERFGPRAWLDALELWEDPANGVRFQPDARGASGG